MEPTVSVGPGTAYTVGIGELSRRINRRPATIRQWEREGYLPAKLHGKRDGRRWRWWTETQALAIEEFARGRYPGSGLPGFHPTPEEVDALLERMRAHGGAQELEEAA